ncbi:MAG: polyphosphate polymerase domain-containing protein [Treponemataceae bacterium]|nr:polyphosphate polymerase domain-containing protein [Treponemataceae bacterium]
MELHKKYRTEHKYVSPNRLLAVQQARIASMMKLDRFADKGEYSIRSVYFDDLYNTCYFENEDGTDPREKFRIRIYNCSDKRISLELKQKERGMCRKISCPIPRAVCEQILGGIIPAFNGDTPYLLKKLIMQMHMRALKPVVIVAYERVPFVYDQGNVRVTFDRNLRSSDKIERFFDGNAPFRPVLLVGTDMMEVKFDGFLPDFINEALQTSALQWTSFSKYYLCRKYRMRGGYDF